MPPKNEQEYLLLDSCVIEYLLDKDMHDSVVHQLDLWCSDVFKAAISEVSYSELINGAKPEKEARVIKILDDFYSFSLLKRIIKGAGILGSLYKEESQELKSIDLGDRLIAMTSFAYNIPIITANMRHFPQPFFHTMTHKNIVFSKSGKDRMIDIGVVRANYPYITNRFNNRS